MEHAYYHNTLVSPFTIKLNLAHPLVPPQKCTRGRTQKRRKKNHVHPLDERNSCKFQFFKKVQDILNTGQINKNAKSKRKLLKPTTFSFSLQAQVARILKIRNTETNLTNHLRLQAFRRPYHDAQMYPRRGHSTQQMKTIKPEFKLSAYTNSPEPIKATASTSAHTPAPTSIHNNVYQSTYI